jgi:hypothetical protein
MPRCIHLTDRHTDSARRFPGLSGGTERAESVPASDGSLTKRAVQTANQLFSHTAQIKAEGTADELLVVRALPGIPQAPPSPLPGAMDDSLDVALDPAWHRCF